MEQGQSDSQILVVFFLIIFIYLSVFGCAGSWLQHVGSSFLTSDRAAAPRIGSTEFQPADPQGSLLPFECLLYVWLCPLFHS